MAKENAGKTVLDLASAQVKIVAALAAVTLAFNLYTCWQAYRRAPLREAASRPLLAASSSYFFDSGMAEPVPVFAVKALAAAGLDPDTAVRAGGMAAWAACSLLLFLLLRRRCGDLAGLLAGMFAAMNPYLGFYAMQGDSHLFALVFLLPFWHFADPKALTPERAALAGLLAGLACLGRLDSCWFALLVLALYGALARSRAWLKAAALTLGVALLVCAPYLAWQKARTGNFLYAQELSLRRWANLEKYGPRPEVPVETAPLSAAGFVFRDGALAAARGAFSGLGRSLSYEAPKVVYYKLIIVMAFVGFYAAFALKFDALLVLAAAAYLPVLPMAALPEVHPDGGLSLRYYLPMLCALCALAGAGFQELLRWLLDELGAIPKEEAGKIPGRK